MNTKRQVHVFIFIFMFMCANSNLMDHLKYCYGINDILELHLKKIAYEHAPPTNHSKPNKCDLSFIKLEK